MMLFIQGDDTRALLDLRRQFLGHQTHVEVEIPDRILQVLLEDDLDDSVQLEIVPVESTPS